MKEEIVLPRMDDMHFHPREDDEISRMVMKDLLAAGFRRGIPIPNYRDPVDTAEKADRDRKRLQKIAPKFEFVGCAMLTRNTTPEIIRDLNSTGVRVLKFMPDGLTTNSNGGISWKNWREKSDCFKEAGRCEMRFMVHMEASYLDAFGKPITHPLLRETLALPLFDELARTFPGLLFTIEHVTTEKTVHYIENGPTNVYGTITAKHLFGVIGHVYDCFDRPIADQWCAPVFKREKDREALRLAAIGGSGKFFFGSDAAPHQRKDSLNPALGLYEGWIVPCRLAEIFEAYSALRKLPDFVAGFGADYHGIRRNDGHVVLRKETQVAPEEVNGVNIYGGGQTLGWKVVKVN